MLGEELRASILASAEENKQRIEATRPEDAMNVCLGLAEGVSQRVLSDKYDVATSTVEKLAERHGHCMTLDKSFSAARANSLAEKVFSVAFARIDMMDTRFKEGDELKSAEEELRNTSGHEISKLLSTMSAVMAKIEPPAKVATGGETSLEDAEELKRWALEQVETEKAEKVTPIKKKKGA